MHRDLLELGAGLCELPLGHLQLLRGHLEPLPITQQCSQLAFRARLEFAQLRHLQLRLLQTRTRDHLTHMDMR